MRDILGRYLQLLGVAFALFASRTAGAQWSTETPLTATGGDILAKVSLRRDRPCT